MKSSPSSDPLPVEFAEAFAAARPAWGTIGQRVLFFNRIESTNDVALALAAGGHAEGAIVLADEQTAGRGRLGRTWHSPPGGGLYLSMILRAPRTVALVTLAAGVALAEAVETATALRADIKWPNDLLVGRRKLAGILAESAAGDLSQIVLGCGLNVSARALPAEVAHNATSLESELGRAVDRATLCAATISAIVRRYGDLLDGRFDAILDAWRSRAPSSRGARVAWRTPSGTQSGVTEGIDQQGALLVRVAGGVERIVGGEVTWL